MKLRPDQNYGVERFDERGAVIIAPGKTATVVLSAAHVKRDYRIRQIVNLGDSDGLVVTDVYYGADRVLPPGETFALMEQERRGRCREVPLRTQKWEMGPFHHLLYLTFVLRNDAKSERRALFELHEELGIESDAVRELRNTLSEPRWKELEAMLRQKAQAATDFANAIAANDFALLAEFAAPGTVMNPTDKAVRQRLFNLRSDEAKVSAALARYHEEK